MVSLRSSNYRTGSEASSAPTHVFHATATTACLVILQMPSRYALLLCLPILLARPCLCYRLFDSRGALVRSVIEGCRSKTPNERAQCYPMLRCILNDIPSEVTARWNAGSSIMAFIPTIVGLLSNSIEENHVDSRRIDPSCDCLIHVLRHSIHQEIWRQTQAFF